MCSITSRGPSLSFMTVITQTGARKEVGLAFMSDKSVLVCRKNIVHSFAIVITTASFSASAVHPV